MSTMSPWMRTDAGTGKGTGTGAVAFDVPGEFELGLFDDPVDHTPLNFDEIPNLGLGAVLKSWDDTLSLGGPVRSVGPVSLATDTIETTDWTHLVGVTGAGAVGSDATRSLGRFLVGPVVASGSFHRQFWFLVTGDEAVLAPTDPTGPDELSAVDAVGELQEMLGVSAAAILRATGIARRTYQHWKATGATPRLSSQARLWDLVLTARTWEETLGDDLVAWIRSPSRLTLLEAGVFGDLTSQALSQVVRLIDTNEDRYSDRLAAGYFETADDELTAREERGTNADEGGTPRSPIASVRRGQIRRARRAGAPRRSTS